MKLKEKMLQHLFNFVFKYNIYILITAVILAIASVAISSQIKFKTSFVDLLPDETPSAMDLNSVTEKAGGIGFLLIPLETKQITEKTIAFAEKLTNELEKLEEISYVILNKNKDFLEPRFLYFLDTEDVITIHDRIATKLRLERKKVNPFYIDLLGENVPLDFSDIEDKYKKDRNEGADTDLDSDYYVNKNNTLLAIRAKPVKPSSDMKFSIDLVKKVEKLITDLNPKSYDPDLEVSVIGRYKTFVEENHILIKDLTKASLIFAILATIILIIVTRKIRSLILIGLPLLLGLSYTFAFTTIFIGHLNLITAFLAAVLAGLGIDFGIHLFIRYNLEREKGTDLKESIRLILCSTGKATLVAALTTSITFLTLSMMHFKGFSEFGLIAGAGILFCFFSVYLVLPSIAILFEKVSPVKIKENKKELINNSANKKFPYPKIILAAWSVVIIASILIIPHINFEGDFRKLKAQGRVVDKQDIIEEEVFGAAIAPALVVVENFEDLAVMEKLIKQIRDKNKKNSKTYIDQIFHVGNLIPDEQKIKYPYIKELNRMSYDRVLNLLEGKELEHIDRLKKISSSKPFVLKDVPDEIVSKLKLPDPNKGWFIMMYPAVMDGENYWEVAQAIAATDEINLIKKEADKTGIKYEIVSETLIYADIMKLIISEGPFALLFALISVIILLFIDFKKIRCLVFTILPLLSGIVSIFIVMYILKLDLTFMNAIMFPTLIGMGIDNTVHLYHRYIELGKGSIMRVIKEVGPAVALSATTTLIGFGSLATAMNYGLRGIGYLAMIGICLAFLAALTMMPAIIQVFENKKR